MSKIFIDVRGYSVGAIDALAAVAMVIRAGRKGTDGGYRHATTFPQDGILVTSHKTKAGNYCFGVIRHEDYNTKGQP